MSELEELLGERWGDLLQAKGARHGAAQEALRGEASLPQVLNMNVLVELGQKLCAGWRGAARASRLDVPLAPLQDYYVEVAREPFVPPSCGGWGAGARCGQACGGSCSVAIYELYRPKVFEQLFRSRREGSRGRG